MNLNAKSDFAQKLVANFLATAALEAALSSPFRDRFEIAIGYGEHSSREGNVVHLIARSCPETLTRAVAAFNSSQEGENGYMWEAKYDPQAKKVHFHRITVKCLGSGCSCC